MRLIFDIESNGLLDELTKIHCIGVKDIDTGKASWYTPDNVTEGINFLEKADEIVGHNIVGFDIPAIQKLYPNFKPKKAIDTLVLGRLAFPNLKDKDFVQRPLDLDIKLYGRHTLKAWGQRLGNNKAEYSGGWQNYSDEMLEYMKQDVEVTHQLYEYLISMPLTTTSIILEHEIAEVCKDIETTGFHFDTIKAASLYSKLSNRRKEIKDEMESTFDPNVTVLKTKTKYTPFNPGSRKQIADRLIQKYNWKPKIFTQSGQAQIDETILSELQYPEAQLLAEYFLLDKRIGMVAEGNQGYLKLVDKNSKLRGRYIPNGAVSGRATHFAPNMAQVPSSRLPYGSEIRECFTVPSTFVLVGSDMSGLELRCLAHYLAKWDNGAYGKKVLDDDIHTVNQKAAQLPTRDDAKRFIYSLIYGAGDQKLGEVIGKGRDAGREIRDKFFNAIPAIKSLRTAVEKKLNHTGYLLGLDGRRLYPRSSHSAVNVLLQSAGALLAKRWLIIARNDLDKKYKYGWNGDYTLSAWVHDEVQLACRKEIAEDVGNKLKRAAQKAGESFNFRCRIDAEYNVGNSWATTH